MSQTDEQQATGSERSKADDPDRAHLAGVSDGCGCAEVWDHLSEQRGD